MNKELEHPADIMYEISGEDIKEILEDFVEVLNKIYSPVVEGINRENEYTISEKEIDDILFDLGNEFLRAIMEGEFPSKIETDNEIIKISYSKIYKINSDIEIKAVAYPKIIDEESKKIRVIFDV
ncbi:hypothetical protein XO10_09605 [Marinitoga sp. 1135]|uniref:Archease protein family (DUF101/UPF0211) n=1 Tax=Marinitoga piezophila (strain DSM 14283 / JCM 11233 / KA3) TaxID=443254 RepID=H2J6P0_MARPK|nr:MULTISPECIES: archease [Marinitoga]AEX86321.1 Archease protein family (DUF101/UPF0211) [Marinitoga piezophila KA3]APT76722.1 hypothetical protein LN42_10300 [Marinitoga sp. 1137]NUU96499.1 hypothetical protein [Marinitoga sp. 1135]NUU98418.1 hypothetical protein [Marinitoga sp. 1138]